MRLVVLAVERVGALLRPVRRRRRDGEERLRRLLERARRVAVGDRDAAPVLGHLDHRDRLVGDARRGSWSRTNAVALASQRLRVGEDRRVGRAVVGDVVEHRLTNALRCSAVSSARQLAELVVGPDLLARSRPSRPGSARAARARRRRSRRCRRRRRARSASFLANRSRPSRNEPSRAREEVLLEEASGGRGARRRRAWRRRRARPSRRAPRRTAPAARSRRARSGPCSAGSRSRCGSSAACGEALLARPRRSRGCRRGGRAGSPSATRRVPKLRLTSGSSPRRSGRCRTSDRCRAA